MKRSASKRRSVEAGIIDEQYLFRRNHYEYSSGRVYEHIKIDMEPA